MQDDEPENAEEAHGMGGGAVAMLCAVVFCLSVAVMAFFNQIGGATPGAATVRADIGTPDAGSSLAQVETPLLALVILDDGTGTDRAMAALDWDVPVAIAVAADLGDSPFRVARIAQSGAEALALLPFGFGPDLARHPNVLRRGLTEAELSRRLGWHLARAGEGIVGAVDHHGGDIRRDGMALRVLGSGLAARGLLMIDGGAREDALLAARLRHDGVRVGRGTVRLARDDDTETMGDALMDAERHAYAWGAAIVLVEAGEGSMAAVTAWLDRRMGGIDLAPVSQVVARLRAGPPR